MPVNIIVKGDKLSQILWAYAFSYLPQKLACPMNGPLYQSLLSIFKKYPENCSLRFRPNKC